MQTIWLDGRKMLSIRQTHVYLKRKLKLPDYYGGNLDALWDLLSTTSEHMRINLLNQAQLRDNLGDYSEGLIQVFLDAGNSNQNINFKIIHKLRFTRVDIL